MVGKTYRPKRVSALESPKEPSKQYPCLGPSPPIASESRGRTRVGDAPGLGGGE